MGVSSMGGCDWVIIACQAAHRPVSRPYGISMIVGSHPQDASSQDATMSVTAGDCRVSNYLHAR